MGSNELAQVTLEQPTLDVPPKTIKVNATVLDRFQSSSLSDIVKTLSAPVSLKSLVMFPVHLAHLAVPVSGDRQIELIANDIVWRYSGTNDDNTFLRESIEGSKYTFLILKYSALISTVAAAAYYLSEKF